MTLFNKIPVCNHRNELDRRNCDAAPLPKSFALQAVSVSKEFGDQLLEALVKNEVRCSLKMKPSLYKSITLSRLDVCEALITNGCDINLADGPEQQTPLVQACVLGDLEMVQLLLAKGAAVGHGPPFPLMTAVENEHLDIAFELLRHNASACAVNKGGETALHLAMRSGFTDLALVLLRYGADPIAPDDRGCTPLAWASDMGHVELMRYLLIDGGCDPNHQPADGPPLLFAAVARGHAQVTQVLLACNADANLAFGGVTPLHMALAKSDAAIVGQLLNVNAQVNTAPTAQGWTALHLAVFRNNLAFVHALLQHGHHPDIRGLDDQLTPLCFAVLEGQVDVVDLLLRKGLADADIPDRFGQTPLYLATKLRQMDVVRVLLRAGARVDDQSQVDGFSPLHLVSILRQKQDGTSQEGDNQDFKMKTKHWKITKMK